MASAADAILDQARVQHSDSGERLRWLGWPEQWFRSRVAIVRRRREISGAVVQGIEPIFVFCHPRVSSTALHNSINRVEGLRAVHIHVVSEAHTRWRYGQPIVASDGVACFGVAPARAAREHMARAQCTRFVTAIRDPVAVNISFFLYWGPTHLVRGQWDEVARMADDTLAELYMRRCPHHSSIEWFEREFMPALSIEGPLGKPIGFDPAVGHATLRTPRAAALIVRSDLTDERKRAALGEFLGVAAAPIERANDSASLVSRALHERLKRVVARIPGYTARLLDSRFARTFWSDAERAGLRDEWARIAEAPE